MERETAPRRLPPEPPRPHDDRKERTDIALGVWAAAVDPRGTLVEKYLASRALELGDDIAGEVLRWHSGLGAMVALFRDIKTGEPQAISRTFLDHDARKIDRRFLGPVGGAAIMLDAFDVVTHGLHIGEGVEIKVAQRSSRWRKHAICVTAPLLCRRVAVARWRAF
jgi:hypothetical protein